jgi:hypothetical protein
MEHQIVAKLLNIMLSVHYINLILAKNKTGHHTLAKLLNLSLFNSSEGFTGAIHKVTSVYFRRLM